MNSNIKGNLIQIQEVANKALELHKNSTERFSGVNYGDLRVVDVYVKYSIHEEDSANYGVLIEECSPTAYKLQKYMLEYLYKNLPDLGGCIYVETEHTNPCDNTYNPYRSGEMTDNDFLQWIYNRMVEVHNENELYDYMHKFKGIIEKNKMTEKDKNQTVRLCCDCKHYKDYKDVFDWIISRIFGCPTLPMCYHPDRWKNVDYVNGTTSSYGLCSIERCTGNCRKEGNNWEAKE